MVASFALVALFSAMPEAQNPVAVLDAASRAIGATTLKSIEYSGTGSTFPIGQAFGPGKPWPRFRMTTYTATIDFAAPAMREEWTRVDDENPPRGGGAGPYVEATGQGSIRPIPFGPQTQARQATGRTDPGFVQIALMTPHGFLIAAAAANATVTSSARAGRAIQVVAFSRGKHTVRGEINDRHLVDRIESQLDNSLLGDMVVETLFTDYKTFNGITFPAHIVQRQGGHPTLDLTVVSVRPNPAATLEIREGGGPPGGPPRIEAEKLADGVWFLNGGAPVSVLVEFADHLVVIEAPGNDARSEAAIAAARRTVPGKPIRYVVNSHGHFDHSGGLRGFVAEGITVITHRLNKPYFEQILAAPHTIAPDRLSRASRPVTIETVDDKRVLSDATRTLELHHVRGNLHNEGLLMAYLPKEKLLVQADAMRPGTTRPLPSPSPFTVNLWENIQRRKLDVEKIVHLHGGFDTMDALSKAAGR
jgi:glyoxylase-like metal-dependent hydrolase (beta-lactamase superfamily II)